MKLCTRFESFIEQSGGVIVIKVFDLVNLNIELYVCMYVCMYCATCCARLSDYFHQV